MAYLKTGMNVIQLTHFFRLCLPPTLPLQFHNTACLTFVQDHVCSVILCTPTTILKMPVKFLNKKLNSLWEQQKCVARISGPNILLSQAGHRPGWLPDSDFIFLILAPSSFSGDHHGNNHFFGLFLLRFEIFDWKVRN